MSVSPPYPPASLLRRAAALLVDWALCQAIAMGLFGMPWGSSGVDSFIPLAVLFVEYAVLVSTLGATVGQRLLGIRVARLDRTGRLLDGPPPLSRVLLRTALLCLAVPAIVMDGDGRGLHDKAARTMMGRTAA